MSRQRLRSILFIALVITGAAGGFLLILNVINQWPHIMNQWQHAMSAPR